MPNVVPGTDFPVWKFKRKGGAKALRIHRGQAAQARADREEDKNRNSGVVLRGDGIGYRDQRLGTLRKAKSRTALDRLTYDAWLDHLATSPPTPAHQPMSLRAYAVEAAADAYGTAYLWYDLPVELASFVPTLLAAVDRRVAAVAPQGAPTHLPFQVWANLAASHAGAMPGKWRTYRGLVLADKEEFDVLGAMNQNAGQDWAEAVAEEDSKRRREGERYRPRELEVPTFFLTILDLAGDTTLTDNDVHKIKAVAQTLAVLRLDGTMLTDEGLRWFTSGIGDNGSYSRLEVLTLTATKVTNSGVVKLGRLSSLRMLDLRGTLCEPRIVPLLYQAASQSLPGQAIKSFRHARDRPDLPEKGQTHASLGRRVNANTEFELFSGSHSLARTLGLLHLLAAVDGPGPHPPARWTKPTCTHVDGVVRTAPEPLTSPDNLYHQLGAFAGPARALHRSDFGIVTSTSRLSRDAMNDEVVAAGRRTTAFAVRKDEVAGGLYEGQGKTGGRATRLEDGGPGFRVRGAVEELDGLSDSEAEGERVEQARADEEEDLRQQARDRRMNGSFYSAPRPVRRAERRIEVAEPSRLMLLRHLPLSDPFNPPLLGDPVAEPAAAGLQADGPVIKRVAEGDTLAKKKLKQVDESHLDFFLPTTAKARAPPSLPRPAQHPPSAARSSSLAPSSLPPATPPSSYLGQNRRAGPSAVRPGKLANRFADQATDGARAKQAAMVRPAAVASRKPLPVPVPSGQRTPLFQQRFH